MNSYKRNIANKLLFSRLLLVLLLLSIIYLSSIHLHDYIVLLILILLLLSVFPLLSVSINNDSFEIKKYYLLGLLPIKLHFHEKDKMEIFPLKTESETEHPAITTGSDSWLDIFAVFIPKYKISHCTLIIKHIRKNGSIAQLQENFSLEEFKLIVDIMRNKIVVNNFNSHMS